MEEKDMMTLKLHTKFMKSAVSKLIAKAIYKKLGCSINIQLDNLDISMIDGEALVKANVAVKLNSDEFNKIMTKLI